MAKVSKDSITNVTTTSVNLSEEAKRPEAIEMEKNSNQVVAPNAMKPPSTSQDPPIKNEESKTMEIVLASLPMLANLTLRAKALRSRKLQLLSPLEGFQRKKL